MPGYGLVGPDEGAGLLPWAWAEQRLRTSRNFWLATNWPDGRPHVMPVWAVWHADALWFSSGGRSRKSHNLAHDPRCVLTTEDANNPVVVDGVAALLTERADLDTFLRIVNDKYGVSYGFELVDPSINGSYRVRPRSVFGLVGEQFTSSPTRWTF
jgi:hypothetical protein